MLIGPSIYEKWVYKSEKYAKNDQNWIKNGQKVFQFYGFSDKSTLKEYEIVLNFNDWVSNLLDKSAQYCKIG